MTVTQAADAEAPTSTGGPDHLTSSQEVTPEVLASHTIGWWRRHHNPGGPPYEPPMIRVLLAHEFLLEAQRRIVIERLDSIMRFLAVGATPEQALYRLCDLVDELWPTAIDDVRASTEHQEAA